MLLALFASFDDFAVRAAFCDAGETVEAEACLWGFCSPWHLMQEASKIGFDIGLHTSHTPFLVEGGRKLAWCPGSAGKRGQRRFQFQREERMQI